MDFGTFFFFFASIKIRTYVCGYFTFVLYSLRLRFYISQMALRILSSSNNMVSNKFRAHYKVVAHYTDCYHWAFCFHLMSAQKIFPVIPIW